MPGMSIFIYPSSHAVTHQFIHPPTHHSSIHQYLCIYLLIHHPSIYYPYFYSSIHNSILAASHPIWLSPSIHPQFIHQFIQPSIYSPPIQPPRCIFFHLFIHPSMLIFTQILVHSLHQTHILWLLGHTWSRGATLGCPQAFSQPPIHSRDVPAWFSSCHMLR